MRLLDALLLALSTAFVIVGIDQYMKLTELYSFGDAARGSYVFFMFALGTLFLYSYRRLKRREQEQEDEPAAQPKPNRAKKRTKKKRKR